MGRLENNSTEAVLLFPPRASQGLKSGTIKLAKSITEVTDHENKLNKKSNGWADRLENRRNMHKCRTHPVPHTTELEQWLAQREQTASNICYKSTLRNREALIMLGKSRKLEKLKTQA